MTRLLRTTRRVLTDEAITLTRRILDDARTLYEDWRWTITDLLAEYHRHAERHRNGEH